MMLRSGGRTASYAAQLARLGAHIRARRRALRWTQKRLAAEAGVVQSVISRVEKGAPGGRGCHISTLVAVVVALRCELVLQPEEAEEDAG
jgi:predicted transcriptional regulator